MPKLTGEQWTGLRQDLVDGGCPMLPEESFVISPVGLKIEQVPSLGVNTVFDLENGHTGYVMDIIITNVCAHPIKIDRFKIKTPWEGPGISLLPGPDKSGLRQGNYCFPGLLAFDRDVVLNHFISSRGRLNPGDEKYGLVLAIEESCVPCHYPETGRELVELSIFDSKGNRYSAEFRLCVDRSVSYAHERVEDISRIVVEAAQDGGPQNTNHDAASEVLSFGLKGSTASPPEGSSIAETYRSYTEDELDQMAQLYVDYELTRKQLIEQHEGTGDDLAPGREASRSDS